MQVEKKDKTIMKLGSESVNNLGLGSVNEHGLESVNELVCNSGSAVTQCLSVGAMKD